MQSRNLQSGSPSSYASKKNQKDIITLPTCVPCNVVENISHGIYCIIHWVNAWFGITRGDGGDGLNFKKALRCGSIPGVDADSTAGKMTI